MEYSRNDIKDDVKAAPLTRPKQSELASGYVVAMIWFENCGSTIHPIDMKFRLFQSGVEVMSNSLENSEKIDNAKKVIEKLQAESGMLNKIFERTYKRESEKAIDGLVYYKVLDGLGPFTERTPNYQCSHCLLFYNTANEMKRHYEEERDHMKNAKIEKEWDVMELPKLFAPGMRIHIAKFLSGTKIQGGRKTKTKPKTTLVSHQ